MLDKEEIEKIQTQYLQANEDGVRKYNQKRGEEHRAKSNTSEDVIAINPSALSVIVPTVGNYSELIGACGRNVYFYKKKIAATNADSVMGIKRMQSGVTIEELEHSYMKYSKTYKTVFDNFKVKIPLTDNIIISGEFDSILKDPLGRIAILEIKSFYGYMARTGIFGNKSTKGKPKDQHLLQVMAYLYMAEEMDNPADYAIIHYIDRTDFHERAFIVELDIRDNNAYPVIDGEVYSKLSLSRMIAKAVATAMMIKSDRLPPRDAEIVYSEKKIQALADANLLSKSAIKKWQSGERMPGDFQCSYCKWKDLCYGPTPYDRSTWRSDEEIIDMIKKPKVEKIL